MSGVGRDAPRKAVPSPKSPNFNDRVAETLQTMLGHRGNVLDRVIIARDLVDAGLISLLPGAGSGSGGGGIIGGPGPIIVDPTPDLTPPPIPTGFAASTSKTMIQAVCDPQLYTQGHGHAKSIVYGATYVDGDPLPVFSAAVKLTDFVGDIFAFPVDPGALYRLWLTWVSVDGVEGLPAGGTNGIEAEAGLLDDANIANLNVSKLRAGSISVGDYIQSSSYVPNTSGWRIHGNGTAEFQNVITRGTIYANFGLIGGNTIDATGIESPGYSTTSGFRLDSSGIFKAYGYSGTRIIDMAATGTSPAFKIGSAFEILGNGTATFSGALSAATGTFAGSLSAATGSFSGSLIAATGSFSGSLSAATGTFAGTLTAAAVNAVNTINIAGNAVSVTNSVSGDDLEISTTLFIPAGENMEITALAVYDQSDEVNVGSDSNNFPDNSYIDINGDVVSVSTTVGIRDVSETVNAFMRQKDINMHMATVSGGLTGLTCTVSAYQGNYKTWVVNKRMIVFGLLR